MEKFVSFNLLDGFRVVDMSQYAPGPYCSLLLADLGAEVFKVEPPGGEPMRRLGPIESDGISGWYKVLNRSKKVVELDLKSEEGKESFAQLLSSSDALLESYRPGVLSRLGFSECNIGKINPNIVVCSLSGWGKTGPYSDRAGHDLNYMALCGALYTSGQSGKPSITNPPVADYASGIQSAFSIVAGLLSQMRKKDSQDKKPIFIDTSIAESVLPWTACVQTKEVSEGIAVNIEGTFLNNGAAFYHIYETKDGRHVTIGAVEEKFWKQFCIAIGKEEFSSRQFEPCPQDSLIADVSAIIATRTQADWVEHFKNYDCCFEPVHSLADVRNNEQIIYRKMLRLEKDNDQRVGVSFPAWINGGPMPESKPLQFLSLRDLKEQC
tara:strand:- start:315 stop:1454 length:1140 start_codon:yes stop_codon:yes gene_type:complete